MQLPKDEYGNPIQLSPATPALARTVDNSISSSTEITLNAATSLLRIYAIAQDVYMKWGTSDVDATNFDEIILAGQLLDFVVPKNSDGSLTYSAINIIERVAGATVIVIEK